MVLKHLIIQHNGVEDIAKYAHIDIYKCNFSLNISYSNNISILPPTKYCILNSNVQIYIKLTSYTFLLAWDQNFDGF